MHRAHGDALVPAGRLVFASVFALLTIAAGGETECYCDGWYSTNTRTLLYPNQNANALIVPGMSYRGAKSTTVNGMECMSWADVFEACTAGFQDNEIQMRSNTVYRRSGDGVDVVYLTEDFLYYMTPDPFGIRGDVSRPSPFDDSEDLVGGHNHCRLVPEAAFLGPRLVPSGPFCFVDASDSSANNFTRDNGWLFSNTITDALREKCPHVTPVPCGISRCEPNAAPGSAVNCARSAAENGGAASAQLLMANGGMELWEMRSNKNGLMRDVSFTRDPPDSWADVTYQAYPDFDPDASYPAGANPSEPRFWDLCLYTSETLEDMDIGYNATTDALSGVLHKVGALTLCDPVDPRGQGITLSQVSSGRDDGETGPSSAARMGFVKVNDTASLKAENGAMASMVPGAVHIARAWVRCAKGSSTVALVVSKLPHDAPVVAQDIPVSMTYHDAMTNLSVAGASTTNTHRCDVDASAYTSSSDAPESLSGWVQLEVAVSSTQAEHDITMQVIVQSHSSDAAVVIDDASWEVKTGTSPTLGTGSDGSIAEWVFSTTCAGGGGGGVSYTDAHKCSSDPTRLFYRLREMGGVPVAHETVHAMVLIGYQSVRCRRPELDAVSQAECPFLSEAILPHLSADDVRAYMDTLSDYELARAMRWDDERVRAPGVRSNLAISMLRAGLPEAIELGVVRVLHAPEYGTPLSVDQVTTVGTSPMREILWHAMSSTTSFKVKNPQERDWRLCGDHAPRREAACDFLSLASHIMSCDILPALIQIPGWEDFVSFDGTYTTQTDSLRPMSFAHAGGLEAVSFNIYTRIQRSQFTLNALPDTHLRSLRERFGSELLDGTYLCFSTFMQFFDVFDTIPSELDAASGSAARPRPEECMDAIRHLLERTFRLLLPQAAPAGKRCKTFEDMPYESPLWIDGRYIRERDTSRGSGPFRGFNFWAAGIAASIAAAMCLLFAVFRYRAARRSAKSPQVLKVSPRTLRMCRILQFIGQGAESEVYLAEVVLARGVKKLIATKMFYKASTAKAEISFYERLPRHENILSVYGCYFDRRAKRHCLAMTFCKHDNMRESMLTKAFPRHAPFVHRTLSGVIDALGALHADGMAHRDLKLDNVLLSCECAQEAECACLRTCSPSLRGRLADFAMARQGALMGVSSANLKGTMMYVPPERVEYDPADHESDFYLRGDVYALGLLTWEVLHYLHSGEVVSCAEAILPGVRSPQDVLIRISSGKFVPPCEFLPESVRRYLRKCWHFQPSKRFRSGHDARKVWATLEEEVTALVPPDALASDAISVRVDAQ